jgi:Uma2 family endonuclease
MTVAQPPSDASWPLLLPPDLRLSPDQFARVCAANPEAVLELTADGHLITMTPTGSETGSRNSELIFQLKAFARQSQSWKVFDSSTGFRLPDGAVFSPDAALIALERWNRLTSEERRTFAPLCPDLVVELASSSDNGPRSLAALRHKMGRYQANGARLGWLLLPEERAVEIWMAGSDAPQRLQNPPRLEGGATCPGLQLDLAEIWAG